MKIAIYGAGSIGGYFGARLAQGGADVHLIARGEHLRALEERGLRVTSPAGDVELKLPATENPAEIGPCDAVLFCVKSTDTETSAPGLAPLLGSETAVVSLQNGVTNEERLASLIDPGHVVGGVAYIMATIAEPGRVQHFGKTAKIVFGELDGRRSARLEALLAAAREAGVDAELSEAIQTPLWTKMAFICALAGMTATVRLPVGELRKSPAATEMFGRIASEVVAVAAARGIALPADTLDRVEEGFRRLPGEWYSSLYYDLTQEKPLELDALHGTVVRLAREHDVATPMCDAIYAALEPWAIRNGLNSDARR